jgi:hypothetical protein
LKAKEGNSGATPQQRAFARERAPRELRVKTRRVVIQPGDESTWLTSSRVILGFSDSLNTSVSGTGENWSRLTDFFPAVNDATTVVLWSKNCP